MLTRARGYAFFFPYARFPAVTTNNGLSGDGGDLVSQTGEEPNAKSQASSDRSEARACRVTKPAPIWNSSSKHADGARPRAEGLAEAMKQKTATSDVMRIISAPPIQSVLDAVTENAARVCGANNAEIFRLENNLLRLAASYGDIPVGSMPVGPSRKSGKSDWTSGMRSPGWFTSVISPQRKVSSRLAAATQSCRATVPRLRRRCCARAPHLA